MVRLHLLDLFIVETFLACVGRFSMGIVEWFVYAYAYHIHELNPEQSIFMRVYTVIWWQRRLPGMRGPGMCRTGGRQIWFNYFDALELKKIVSEILPLKQQYLIAYTLLSTKMGQR